MLILILSLLYTVSAQTTYSRTYLRGLKQLENERIQTEYIQMGIAYIEQSVFTAAKQGLVKFTTEPFDGCEAYTRPGVDKAVCENVVTGIRSLVYERFPDSEVLYDTVTRRYTLRWD
jgi:hypothetical protein